MKRAIICFVLALSFFACKKDDLEEDKNLFVNLEIDDVPISYTEKDSIYYDAIYWSYVTGGYSNQYQYGGGFKNGNFRIENFEKTSYDQISIRFQNIPLDSIVKGNYNFLGKNKTGGYTDIGVEIIWMNPSLWEIIYNKYLQSPAYLSFIKLNPPSQWNALLSEYSFMSTTNVMNSSYVEITNRYYKDYKRYSFRTSSYEMKHDLIVEGKIRGCYISSIIDKSIIKELKGNFRIHIPQP